MLVVVELCQSFPAELLSIRTIPTKKSTYIQFTLAGLERDQWLYRHCYKTGQSDLCLIHGIDLKFEVLRLWQ